MFTGSAAVVPGQQAAVPTSVQRVVRYYAEGPSADYDGDAGSIGTVGPVVLTVSGEAVSTGVVEVSFQYRTRGPGPFVVNLGVREVDGPRATVRPDELTLAPAVDGASTTVRFLVPALAGGSTYEVHLGVNSVFRGRGVNRVSTRKVLVTVELSG